MCLLQLSQGIVYVTLFVMPVSMDERPLCCLLAVSLLLLQSLCIKSMGQIPFLGSVTEMSSVMLQKDVSLVSPRLAGL